MNAGKLRSSSVSALVVAALLAGVGVVVGVVALRDESPAPPTAQRSTPAPGATRPVRSPVQPSVPAPAPRDASTTSTPRLATAADLVRVLEARGLSAARLIDATLDWRQRHGYFGAAPLLGEDGAAESSYAQMDEQTLWRLAEAGDLAALQAYAGMRAGTDPFGAIEHLVEATQQGSVAAMLELADLLAGIDANAAGDPRLAQKLLALRGGRADHDLRQDALAWQLAAIRRSGPPVLDRATRAALQSAAAALEPGKVLGACAQSLAILADLSAEAATRGSWAEQLPPVFMTPPDAYSGLPCEHTAAPLMPPRAVETCTRLRVDDAAGAGAELWICDDA